MQASPSGGVLAQVVLGLDFFLPNYNPQLTKSLMFPLSYPRIYIAQLLPLSPTFNAFNHRTTVVCSTLPIVQKAYAIKKWVQQCKIEQLNILPHVQPCLARRDANNYKPKQNTTG